jgi:uncharacterized protein (DUF2237 family)
MAMTLAACGSTPPPASDGCALGCAPSASSRAREVARADASGVAEATGATNAIGGALAVCGTDPMTGWLRDGSCRTDENDRGSHTVCAQVTEEFLRFTASRGNDLVTPRGSFRGLRAGDRWCLCDGRFAEADEAGVAPPVVLEATNAAALRRVDRARLEARAVR